MYIGIDIGGTKCAVIKADDNGNIIEKIKFKTCSCADTIEALLGFTGKMGRADAIGISCGGPLNSEKGVILSPPNLPGWDNVEIVGLFEKRFGIKTFLQNDANACALAEWKFGAGKGCNNMIFLTFGTGMGAGLILNGRLFRGACGNAGEVGHIRLGKNGPVGFGKQGSFEGFCSGNGLAQLGRTKALELLQAGRTASFCDSFDALDKIDAKRIAEYADKGYEDAIEVYRSCGEQLGFGLSILIDILNPEKIVLGSIYARSQHLLYDAMVKVLRNECLIPSLAACDIVPAELGEQVGDYAAISTAILGSKGVL